MTNGDRAGTVRALDLKGLPLGEAPFTFGSGEQRNRGPVRPAGRNPQRHRAARNRRRAFGRRRAAARQALAAAHRRRRVRLHRRHARSRCSRPPTISPARLTLSPMCALPKALRRRKPSKRFLDQKLPMMMLADVGNVTGDARERLTSWIDERRRAGAFCRPASCRRRRRSRAGEAAPRRAHSRRQPELGQAAAAGGLSRARARSPACRCRTTSR